MRARVLQNPPLEGKAPITTHGPTGKMSAGRLDRTCLHVVRAPRQGPGPGVGVGVIHIINKQNTRPCAFTSIDIVDCSSTPRRRVRVRFSSLSFYLEPSRLRSGWKHPGQGAQGT